jgi:hypothetical protein
MGGSEGGLVMVPIYKRVLRESSRSAQHESADVAVKSQTVMHVVIYGINIDRVSNSSSDGWHFLNPAQTLGKSYVNCLSKTDVLLSFLLSLVFF